MDEKYISTHLANLPSDWKVDSVGNLFEIKQGKQLSSKEKVEGKVKKPFLRTSNVFWGKVITDNLDYMYFTKEEYNKLRLIKGDVLVCEGGDIGRCAILKNDNIQCTYQNHLHRLRSKDNNINHIYFVYWMEHAIKQRKMYIYDANRTTIPNLSSSRLKSFILPVPTITEQKKIAYVLSAVQEAKVKTEAVIQTTKELKKSLMKYLFTYGPVPVEEAEKVKLKETEIGNIPYKWEVKKIGECINKIQYGLSKRGRNTGKYPILRMNNLIDGYVRNDDIQYIDIDEHNLLKYRMKEDDILFNRTNSYERVGKTAIYNLDGNYIFASYLIRIQTIKEKILPKYLNYYLNWELAQQRLKSLATRAISQSNISASKLKGFEIPVPPPHTQQKICNILSSVNDKLEYEKITLLNKNYLYRSFLNYLMRGKLRVNNLEFD